MTTNRANKNSGNGTRQDLILFSMDMRKTTILLWIVQGLLAVLFLSAGGMKAGRGGGAAALLPLVVGLLSSIPPSTSAEPMNRKNRPGRGSGICFVSASSGWPSTG